MAGRLDKIVKDLNLDRKIEDNVSSGRSTGITNSQLNAQNAGHFETIAEMVRNTVQQSGKTKTALDMQRKRQEQEEALQPDMLSVPNESQIRADAAKQNLERYLQSDERKKWLQKAQADLQAQALLTGSTDGRLKVETDKREDALKAEISYWENMAKAERNAEKTRSNMDTINAMDENERAAFDKYVRGSTYVNPQDIEAYKQLKAKYGDELDRLKESYEWDRNQKRAENVQAKTEGMTQTTGGKVLHSIAAIPASIGGGVSGTAARIDEAINRTGQYETLSPYTLGDIPNVYAQTVQNKTIEGITQGEGVNLDDGISARELGALGYQGVMGAAETGGRLLATGGNPAAALGLAAMKSFSGTVQQASAQGASPEEALALATLNAGIEVATEKIPMDNLLKIAKSGAKPAAQVIMSILKQSGIEILEEEAALIGTTLAEAAILRDKSAYQQSIGEMVAGGMSYEDAKAQADRNLLEEAKQTAIITGFSGMFSAGGAEAYNAMTGGRTGSTPTATPTQTAETQTQTEQEEAVEPDADLTDTDNVLEGLQQEQADQMQEADENWMQQTFEEANRRAEIEKADTERAATGKRQQEVYEDLQAAKRRQRDLQKEIEKAEAKLAETGKGSQARIDQLKAELEQQNNLVAQIESQYNYFVGDYERTVGEAVARQEAIFEETKAEMDKAWEDHEAGRITDAQFNAIARKYNNAAGELHRLRNMTQEEYIADLASVGLLVDGKASQSKSAPAQQTATESGNWMEQTFRQEEEPAAPVNTPTAPVNTQTAPVNTPVAPVNTAETETRGMSTQTVDTKRKSTKGGQVKENDRAGTPEQNFTGKPAYYATLSEDNAQADRRDDVRPMELPKQDINGNNISAVTGNVYASRNTPSDLAEAMEEPVARGDFSYVTITNDQATERAWQTIVREGSWETARERFLTDVENGNAGAELTARGALILNHYGEVYEQVKVSGDTEAAVKARRDWLQALIYVRKLGTNTAQGQQAFRIIRNLMPQDKLTMMQMATNDLAREMKIPGGLEIDQSLIQEYENAQTDEQRDEVVTKIQKNVAQQIPSTMLDMWNALRYTNMLGNMKTIVRNTFGNAVNMQVYRAKDMTAAAVEAFIEKTGGKIDRTKTAFVNKQLKQDCGEYYDMVKEAVSSGAKFNESMNSADQYTQGILNNRGIFVSDNKVLNTILIPMEVYRKATDWAMNNKRFGDAYFGKAAFTHAMAGYLQANGVKPGTDLKTVDQALMDKAMAYAVQEAQEATFHDNSALARVLGRLKKDAGIFGQGIAPFTRTPANLLTRAEEFSPLGIINTAVMAAQKAAGDTNLANKAGKLGDFARAGQEITNADIVNGFAKAFTGVQLFAIGAALYSLGFLTVGPDDDEDKAAFDKENGVLTFALRILGINISMEWLTPVAMPMFMGAEMAKTMQDKDNITFADMEQLFTSIANPMLQMSMLQGINDSLDNIQNAENNLGQFMVNSAVSYLTQGLTNTALGQIEKSTEGTRQTTYIDKDSQTPKWLQYQLGKASQKIPGWDYQQTEYINARGETEKQPTGAMGLAYNMLSPAYVKRERFDNVTDELYRMDKAGAEGNVFFRTPDTTVTYTDKTGETHANYNMTPEQADVYKRQAGQLDARITEDLINSEGYENLTEKQKEKARADIRSYALKTAEIAAIGESHTGYSEAWMDKLTGGKEAREILQRTVKSDIANAVEAMSTAWEKGYNEKERGEKLQEAYDAYASLPAIDRQRVKNQATGEAARYIDARNSGISHKKYMDTAKLLDGIVPEPGKKEARAVQKAETVAASRTLTEAEKEFLIKQQVSDSQAENIDELQDLSQTNKELQKIGGVTMEMYAELYRDHEDYTKGDGKKKRTYKYWAKKYGISEKTAKALYEVFS